ncbi:MAG: DNRLRE domain-containing protein, partial [Candidatus Limnocylindrales bacterium]
MFFKPVGSTTYQPIDVGFAATGANGAGLISDKAPVAVSVNASSSEGDFLTTASGDYTVGFALAPASAEVVPSVPHATGAVADFPSLMPGIDLRVIAGANGAKSFFIWRVAPADPTIRYVVDAPGLMLVPEADGSIALRDATGTTVATIPHPYAVDSTPDAFVGGGRYTSDVTLALEPDGRTITVSVDPGWLKGAVFPVYVDPSTGWVSNTGMDSYGDAHVASAYPNDHFADYVRPDSPYSHELWNGTDPSGTSGESYDYLKWDLSAYANVTVDAANLRLYPYHQYYNAPTSETTYARRVIGTWKETTVTWGTKPPGDMPVTAACVEGVWCIWDVTAIVQTWLAGSGSATNSGFRLDTSGKGSTYWKRFIASEEGGSTRPALAITYHTAVVATATPALTGAISWTYTDSGGAAQTTYHVDVAATQAGLGSANLATSGEVAGTASAWAITPTTPGTMTDGTSYWYQVRASNGTSWTPWVQGQFTYDAYRRGAEGYYSAVPFDLGGGLSLEVGVQNGEARLSRALFSIPSSGPPAELDLAYSSLESSGAGLFGPGWSSNLTQYLTFAAGQVLWHRPDGGRVMFTGSGSNWVVQGGHYETLSYTSPNYAITLHDQTRLVFAGAAPGRLVQITNRFGKALVLDWTSSPATATPLAGQAITLTISGTPARVTKVTDPAGRAW